MQQYNIAILPPNHIQQQALDVSRSCKGMFVLGDDAIPHITLAHIESDEKQIYELFDELKDMLTTKPVKSFLIKAEEYNDHHSLPSESHWIDVSYEKSLSLETLFKVTCELLKKENITITTPSIYRPHLTFSRTKEPINLSKIPQHPFSFNVETIGFFYLGDHGTCTKILDHTSLLP